MDVETVRTDDAFLLRVTDTNRWVPDWEYDFEVLHEPSSVYRLYDYRRLDEQIGDVINIDYDDTVEAPEKSPEEAFPPDGFERACRLLAHRMHAKRLEDFDGEPLVTVEYHGVNDGDD